MLIRRPNKLTLLGLQCSKLGELISNSMAESSNSYTKQEAEEMANLDNMVDICPIGKMEEIPDEELYEEFINACYFNNYLRVEELLTTNPELALLVITTKDTKVRSVLSIAVKGGYIDIAELLIFNGAVINNDNIYPHVLLSAVKANNTKMVKMLITHKADTNCVDGKRQSALHWATYNGSYDIIELLLKSESKTNINIMNQDGNTPLHIAAMYGRLEMTEMLLHHGADANLINYKKKTPAELSHDDDIIDLLRIYTTVRNPEDKSLSMAYHNDIKISSHRNISLISDMEENDVEKDFMRTCRAGDMGKVSQLVSMRANLPFIIVNTGRKVKSPLSVAVKYGHIKLAEFFILNGSDINDDQVYPPILITAVKSENIEMVMMLVDNNANVNCVDAQHQSPLAWATCNGSDDIVKLLVALNKDIDINIVDQDGNTPLHIAAMTGRVGLIKLLLEHKANANMLNYDGEPPIGLSINDEIVKLLQGHIEAKEEAKGEVEM